MAKSLHSNFDHTVIGGGLTPKVLDQLTARENIISKKSGRVTNDHLYLNSSTGWVKLTSSVNTAIPKTLDLEDPTKPIETKYNSALAEANVLLGGTLYKDGSLQAGVGGNSGAYKQSKLYGQRPMAGITSMTVNTKNQFGTLREGKVEFKANSIEQLNDLEQLYLRPGYTVLLEWGHSLYVDNDGNISTLPHHYKDYFTSKGKAAISEEIQKLRISSSYNYDAMFGFIKNFSWSFNLDGSYNCSVDIISPGELIESLQVILTPNVGAAPTSDVLFPYLPSTVNNNTTAGAGPKQLPDKAEDFFASYEGKSLLHKVLYTIKIGGDKDAVKEALTLYLPSYFSILEANLGTNKLIFNFVEIAVDVTNTPQAAGHTGKVRLVPLSHILEMINSAYMVSDQNNDNIVNFYTGNKDANVKTTFLTFDQHFALDPNKVVLPKAKDLKSRFVYNVSKECEIGEGSINDILNIYVGIPHVLGILDKVTATDSVTENTLFTFIRELLASMQKTMGGINDFDLHYDEDEFTYYIVDRKVVPKGNKLKDTGSIINLVGLNSMLENLSFTSKLSSNITTMMAVSAQYGSTYLGVDTQALLNWNLGIQDRHLVTKNIGTEKKTEANPENEQIVKEDDIRALVNHLDKANSNKTNKNIVTTPEELGALISAHTNLMVSFVEYTTKSENTNPAGIVPFELSFSIKGIAGFKIGQAFVVPNEIIPEKYKDKIGFLITGVSNSIKSGRWVTDIKTQMITITPLPAASAAQLTLPEYNDTDFINTILGGYNPAPKPDLIFYNPLGRKALDTRSDGQGGGEWTSFRDGKKRLHKAWDVLVKKGDKIGCPFPGKVTFNSPYSQHQSSTVEVGMGRFEITGVGPYQGITMIIGYVFQTAGDLIDPKRVYKPGDYLGVAGSVYTSYPKKYTTDTPPKEIIMLDHLHIGMKSPLGTHDPKALKWQNINIGLTVEELKIKLYVMNLGFAK